MSGRDGGPAAMECRPAPLSAVSGAPNPVPRGVIGAANVGWPGPSSASLALFECRPLHLEGTKGARYRWRDSAMLMLTFYHGLRASEVCHLRRQDVDLTHGRIWIARLKGSLSTEQPLLPQELRQRPVSEINQQA